MLVSVVIGGFILSFRKWGIGGTVNLNFGFYNLVISALILAVNLFIAISIIKLYGLKIGHKVQYSFGKFSTMISLFVAFLGDGWIPFISPGTFKCTLMTNIRHGRIRPGLQLKDLATLSLLGAISSLIIAFIAKLILLSTPGNYVIERIMFISVIFAIVSMLPFPEFNGFHVFFCSRMLYIFTFISILAIGIFFLILGIVLSLILALLIGFIAWILYYLLYESKL
ncbi:MAG: hypothetical protein U9R08_05615 [Nanoarchaeota archaeon]|nr:hypothetical protein [Nanoarchaeota archaeon]